MASPTEAELNAQIQNAVAMLDNELQNTTIVADLDAYIQSIESDFPQEQSSGASLFRLRLAAALGGPQPVLTPVFVAFAHHIVQTPERSIQPVLDRIYRYFIDNARTVQSRGFVFDAGEPFSFTGVGDGQLYRLTEDEEAFDLENQFDDTKTVKCIKDAQTGADRHEEVFEFRGTRSGIDVIDVLGSGIVRRTFKAKSSNDSELLNPSFESFSTAGQPAIGTPYTLVAGDTITGWTIDGAVTNFQLDRDVFAKNAAGEATPTGLRFLASDTLRQAFSVNRLALSADAPHLSEVWVFRESLATGNVTITWGSRSQVFTIASLVNNTWNRLVPDRDQDLWPIRFNLEDADFSIEVDALAVGTVVIDQVFFGEMDSFDGSWYHLTGGAVTKFQLDDVTSLTDTIASDSKIQQWLWRAFGRYLPHSGAPTLTDPP